MVARQRRRAPHGQQDEVIDRLVRPQMSRIADGALDKTLILDAGDATGGRNLALVDPDNVVESQPARLSGQGIQGSWGTAP
jgi:hypothetical protein